MRKLLLFSFFVLIGLSHFVVVGFGEQGSAEKTPREIIENYIESVGGIEKINNIKTIVTVMEAEIQGMAIEMSTSRDIENMRMMQQTVLDGNVMQKTVVSNNQGYMSAMGQKQELKGDQLEAVKTNLYVFPEVHYEDLGFKLELGEPTNVNGEEAYLVVVTTSEGLVSNEYFSMESGLKLKVSSEMAGEIEFSDYQEVEGVLFPMQINISNPMLPAPMESRVISLEINETLDDSLFQ